MSNLGPIAAKEWKRKEYPCLFNQNDTVTDPDHPDLKDSILNS